MTITGLGVFEQDGFRPIEPPIPYPSLPVSPNDRYESYPFIPRIMNTLEIEYIQNVNHCQAQNVDGSVFIFNLF